MGRRRRQKVTRRPQRRIPDTYAFPSCGDTAIKIEVYKSNGLATVKCGSCGLEMSIDEVNPLTEQVDVYGSFIDKFYESRKVDA